MSEDRSRGPRIKIQRAKKHIHELDANIQAFVKRDPYRVFVEKDVDTGNKVWRINVRRQPPPRWSAIVGDAAHNLRSALDLLIQQLVLANGETPTDETCFPIFKAKDGLKSSGLRQIEGVSPTAKRMVRLLKPYKGGNDALWRLHRLDIVDKHRLLIPVGAAHSSVRLPIGSPDWMGGQFRHVRLGVTPTDRQFPLKDGDILFSAPADYNDDDVEVVVQIALNETGVIEGEAVIPALHELADLVKGIVASFEPLLS